MLYDENKTNGKSEFEEDNLKIPREKNVDFHVPFIYKENCVWYLNIFLSRQEATTWLWAMRELIV